MKASRVPIATLACLCLLAGSGRAVAQGGTQAAQQQPAPSPAASSGAGLNFDLFDDASKPPAVKTAAEIQEGLRIEKKVKLRRGLLLAHQAVGFVTLAALAATVVLGHLDYYDKYTSGDFTGRYQNAHLDVASITTGLFAATGVLALLAPNPYPKPYKLDTAMVHRVSMGVATAGMLAQIILGPIVASRVGKTDQASLALGHVVTGYATFGFMTIGVVSYLF